MCFASRASRFCAKLNTLKSYDLYILKRKSFATLLKCEFLLIDSKISFGAIRIAKSNSLPCIQNENQNAVAYGCRESF